MQTRLRFVANVVHRMIYRDGLKMFYYQVLTSGMNTATGVPTREYNVIPVRRALFMPVDRSRGFDYDLSFIAANKNFVTGAYFDREAMIAVINVKDMRGVKPVLDDFLVMNKQNYEVKSVAYYADNQLLVLGLEGLTNKKPQIYTYAETRLAVEDSAS